jgi:hypothetical protein
MIARPWRWLVWRWNTPPGWFRRWIGIDRLFVPIHETVADMQATVDAMQVTTAEMQASCATPPARPMQTRRRDDAPHNRRPATVIADDR